MKKYYLILIIIIISFSSCIKKDVKICPTDFIVYGTLSPYDSIYHLGDTLTLETKYHYMVYEERTNKKYDLKDVSNIESSLSISNLDTICENIDSRLTDFIDLIPNNNFNYRLNTFSGGQTILYSNITFSEDTFYNEIKIVFKQKGLFILIYGPSCVFNRSDFPGKCNNSDFSLYTRLNSNKDNNIQLLALSPDEHFNSWMLIQHPEKFYRGGYCYKVID